MIAGTLLIPLTAAALGIALVQLRSVILGKSLPGCGEKTNCDELTNGRWSRIGLVPVAFPGAAVYFAFFISSILAHPQFPVSGLKYVGFPGDTAIRVEQSLFFCAVLSAGAAIWFFALQAIVLRKFCVYCSVAQALALLASGLAFYRVKPVESVFLAGVLFVGVFILGQILVPAKLYAASTASQSEVKEIREEEREVIAEKVAENAVPIHENGENINAVADQPLPACEGAGGTSSADDTNEQNDTPEPTMAPETGVDSIEQEIVPAGEEVIADGSDPTAGEDTVATENVGGAGDFDIHRAVELVKRRVVVMEGKISLSARLWPIVGDPSAKRMLIDLMDFTCEHCRKQHGLLKEMMANRPGEWAAVLMPIPMETGCNPTMKTTPKEHIGACEYTKLAMAVFHGKPDAFAAFCQWLCEGERPPELEAVRQGAKDILGEEGLAWALADPRQEKRLNEAIAIYDAVGQGQIPKLLFEKQLISGPVITREQLEEIVKRELELAGEK